MEKKTCSYETKPKTRVRDKSVGYSASYLWFINKKNQQNSSQVVVCSSQKVHKHMVIKVLSKDVSDFKEEILQNDLRNIQLIIFNAEDQLFVYGHIYINVCRVSRGLEGMSLVVETLIYLLHDTKEPLPVLNVTFKTEKSSPFYL